VVCGIFAPIALTIRRAPFACIFTGEAKQADVGGAEGFEQVLTRLASAGLFLDWWALEAVQTLGCSWIAKRSKADVARRQLGWQARLSIEVTVFLICLTFDVRGGPPAGRPLDGVVRRATLSKEMTGTRGGTNDAAGLLDGGEAERRHLGTCGILVPTTLTIRRAMFACIFTGEAKQANVGVAEGFEQVLTRLTSAGLFLDWWALEGYRPWAVLGLPSARRLTWHDSNLDGKRDSALRSRYS